MSKVETDIVKGNLLRDLPDPAAEESFGNLARWDGCRLERIVSRGQTTPAGQWLEQSWDEWVAVVDGAARLRFEDGEALDMSCGDFVLIEAGRRHRVDWTTPYGPTVWLALHVAGQPLDPDHPPHDP